VEKLSGKIQQLSDRAVQTVNSHFNVTLPADISADYYPNNTVAHFVTKLLECIHLEGNYEMGLAEFIYPHSWYNVDNNDVKTGLLPFPKWKKRFFERSFIQSGYYEDGSAFADALNRKCHRAFDDLDVEFCYNETIGRFSLAVHSRVLPLFEMFEDLQHYHGFRPQSFSRRHRETIFRHDDRPSTRRKSRTECHVRLLRRDVLSGRRRNENAAAPHLERYRQARRRRPAHLRPTALLAGGPSRIRHYRNRNI
jgi:hypothetical protein